MKHLEVSGLSVRYGAVRALHDVTLEVARGGSVALLGANGAGKTTTLRAIGGLLAYHGGCVVDGDIRFEDRSTARADASSLVAGRSSLVAVPVAGTAAAAGFSVAGGGSSKLSRRSSTRSCARSSTSDSRSLRTMSMALSTRSRTIDSTSRPT